MASFASTAAANLDYYLIVIHGVTVAYSDTYFNMKLNSNRVNFFANFGTSIHFNSLPVMSNKIDSFFVDQHGQYVRNPTYFNGLRNTIARNQSISHDFNTKEHINVINVVPDEAGVFKMPPLVFAVSQNDFLDEKRVLIGIYKYSKNNPYVAEQVVSMEQLYEFAQQRNHTYGILTYRDLIDVIFDLNGRNKDYRYNLGFFCCRALDYWLNLEECYKSVEFREPFRKLFSPVEKFYPRLKKNDKILELQNNALPDADIYYMPLTISTKVNHEAVNSWVTLLGLHHQGCALNVLAFYNFILNPFAHQSAACLDLNGTSIFRIIDYLNVYLTNRNPLQPRPIHHEKSADEIVIINKWLNMTMNDTFYPDAKFPASYPEDTKYTVLRLPIKSLITKINEIFKYLFLREIFDNVVIILKFYGELKRGGKYAMRGHTVSFLFHFDSDGGSVYLVDPQNFETFSPMTPVFTKKSFHGAIEMQSDANAAKFYEFYEKNYTFFDVIYVNNSQIAEMVEANKQKKVDLSEFLLNIRSDHVVKDQFDDKTYMPFQYGWFLPYDTTIHYGGKRARSAAAPFLRALLPASASKSAPTTRSAAAASTTRKSASARSAARTARAKTASSKTAAASASAAKTARAKTARAKTARAKTAAAERRRHTISNDGTYSKNMNVFLDTLRVDDKKAVAAGFGEALRAMRRAASSSSSKSASARTDKSKVFDTFVRGAIAASSEKQFIAPEFIFDVKKIKPC